MKYYAIIGCETNYQGLHGMYECEVIEAENEVEAEDYGQELSRQVIESYGLEEEYLRDDFGEDYEEKNIDEDDIDDCISDHLMSYIYEINRPEEKEKLWDNLFQRDPEDFILKYKKDID